MFHKLLIAFFIISLGTSPSLADIYKFVDKKGVVTLTNRPSSPKYKLILRTRKAWQPSKYRNMTTNRSLFNHTINLAARRFHLNQALIHAVIQAESGYNPNAVSKAGAVGLMQLMPDTARHYGVTDRHNPAQNVQGGSHYLSDLLRRFGNLKLALAAYNAGETAIARYGNRIPPYRETRAYVKKVLALFRQKVGKHLH